jgi:hypothetical protein
VKACLWLAVLLDRRGRLTFFVGRNPIHTALIKENKALLDYTSRIHDKYFSETKKWQ